LPRKRVAPQSSGSKPRLMRQNLSVVTLGTRSFTRSLRFYRDGLGWKTDATESDPIAFFDLNGTILALFSRSDLAADATVTPKGGGFTGVTLAHNARSVREVLKVFSRLENLGARIVKRPQSTSWGGFGGYFADPDGNLWEVVYNPGWKLDRKGRVVRP